MTSSKGGYLSKFKGLGSPSKPDKLGSGFICSGPAHCISLFPLGPMARDLFCRYPKNDKTTHIAMDVLSDSVFGDTHSVISNFIKPS